MDDNTEDIEKMSQSLTPEDMIALEELLRRKTDRVPNGLRAQQTLPLEVILSPSPQQQYFPYEVSVLFLIPKSSQQLAHINDYIALMSQKARHSPVSSSIVAPSRGQCNRSPPCRNGPFKPYSPTSLPTSIVICASPATSSKRVFGYWSIWCHCSTRLTHP